MLYENEENRHQRRVLSVDDSVTTYYCDAGSIFRLTVAFVHVSRKADLQEVHDLGRDWRRSRQHVLDATTQTSADLAEYDPVPEPMVYNLAIEPLFFVIKGHVEELLSYAAFCFDTSEDLIVDA